MTDGQGIPIANGGLIGGHHNALYHIVPQHAAMIKEITQCGLCVENSVQNADKGFDSKALRRCIARRRIFANIKSNPRNRKKTKREPKPYFTENVYQTRFINERCFAWIDSFRTLLIRFDTLDDS